MLTISFPASCTCIFLLLAFTACVEAKTGEVCFPFGSSDPTIDPPQLSQGHPGKIGPRGPPGLPGEVGEPGSPGRCACNPDEIEQLREENRLQDMRFANLFNILRISDRPKICGIGLKDGRVRDEDIAVSRTRNSYYQKQFARLDRQGTERYFGGWVGCTSPCGLGEWIQVDLRNPTRVVAVVTQGLNYPGPVEEWVTSYKISYGNSTTSLQVIQNESGSDLIFSGNTDRDTHVTNEFPSPIIAKYFRLIVQTWHNQAVVRMEYLTC